MTDIASYLNLLFATIAASHCPRTGEPTPHKTSSQILEAILSLPEGTEIELRALGVQGVRRGVGVRLHGGAEKGMPPTDHRRTARVDLSGRVGARRVGGVGHGRGGGPVRRRPPAREGDQAGIAATLLVGDGMAQVHIVKRRVQGGTRSDFTRGCCSATHHFVYGDIGPEFFQFNNPESACRTCGGLGVDKLTHPELLIPDPHRSIAGGCFVREAFKYNPDTWDGRGNVQPVEALRFSLDTPWEQLSEAARTAILYGVDTRNTLQAPPDAKVKRDELGGKRGGLRRGLRGASSATIGATGSAARASSGMEAWLDKVIGRAHLSRLQRRTRAGDATAVHRGRQDDLRRGPAQLRRAARVSLSAVKPAGKGADAGRHVLGENSRPV